MKWVILCIVPGLLMSCGGKFEPELRGWQAYTRPSGTIYLIIDGKKRRVSLPGALRGVTYRYAQWTRSRDRILLSQLVPNEGCYDYRLLAIDTTGAIRDTIYSAPTSRAVNFKLAPNDSLVLLKTFIDRCDGTGEDYVYTFYNRFTRSALPDTVAVSSARGIPLRETVWSPDSRKVIIQQVAGRFVKAYTYDLVTKDTAYIDKGNIFVWSPADKNLIAYIKDYSIYTRNMATRESELIYEGKRKKSVTDFRWSPQGDYLVIHLKDYFLNVDAGPFQRRKIVYYSMEDRGESEAHYDDQRIDTWRE